MHAAPAAPYRPNGRASVLSANDWNTLVETTLPKATAAAAGGRHRDGYAGVQAASIQALTDVQITETSRTSTGIGELDRVLGGGLVAGSVTLIGGDPGIGKSTLLLQTMASLCQTQKGLYATGEESPSK